jgi:hypothetical protein
MQKKDFRLILVVGVAVGLLIQPIILNVLPQVHLGILGRILIFVFFAVFAPFALWIADLVSRWWKGLYQFAQFAAVGTLEFLH